MTNIVGKVLEVSGGLNAGFDTNGGDFDMLREAVVAGGLVGALSDDDGNLTVFAPTDEGFVNLAQNLGYAGSDEGGSFGHIVDALTLLGGGDPIPLLQQVLTYHVVDGEIFSSAVIPANDGLEITTLQGGKLTLDTIANGPKDNAPGLDDLDPGLPDPKIILTAVDIDVGNGVIHAIDNVLLPVSVTGILSQPGTDFIIGDGGGDYYRTGGGNDFIDGNGGSDIIRAGSGDDVAIGGDGGDVMFGGRGKDIMIGESGSDKIFGGRGQDTIDGGAGNDWMSGGWGSDTFVFEKGDGHDKIAFFTDGKDKIDLSGYDGIDNFADIKDDISGRFYGSKIDLDEGDSIVLYGVRKHQLDASDFIFAEDTVA